MKWNGTLDHKVGHRQPNYPALCVLWFLRFIEYYFYTFLSIFETKKHKKIN